MGIFDPVTNSVQFGAYRLRGGWSRGLAAVGASFSAHNAMSMARWQLRSYEGRELFDAKKLSKYLKIYHKLKRQLLLYRAKKVRGGFESAYIQRIYNKYRNKPQLLERVLIYEVEIFTYYYEQLLQVVSLIQLKEKDLVLQENAAIMRDVEQLISLINKIPETKDTVIMQEDFRAFKKEAQKLIKKEKREDRLEFLWRKRLAAGGKVAKKAVGGFAGFFLRRRGLSYLAHKMRKFSRRIFTWEYRRFGQQFAELRQEIEKGRITPVTLSRLRYLMKNYEKIRRYYFLIDRDIALIMCHLFTDFEVILNECVVPFYATLKNIKGAEKIGKISEELKNAYKSFSDEALKEEFEIKSVYNELIKFAQACQNALGNVQKRNFQVIKETQQQLALAA